MKAIILAAGLGTRLNPLTDVIPKCLMPIHGRPLLEYWIETLINANVNEILINLHHHAGMINQWIVNSKFRADITTTYEKELLGTGGTLLKNREFIQNDPVMLIHGDNFCLANIHDFIKMHDNRPKHIEITMMTFKTDTPYLCGIVKLNSSNVVTSYSEKPLQPSGNLANAAVYILEPKIFDFLNSLKRSVIDFSTEVIPNFLNRIVAFHNNVYHRDIGNLDSYLKAQTETDHIPSITFENDYWNVICDEKRIQLFAEALAKGANSELIDYYDKDKKLNLGLAQKANKNVLLNVKSKSIDFVRTVSAASNLNFPVSKIMIFQGRKRSMLSTKDLYLKYGLRYLYLYSNANQ
jgi:mannose-1-phosphate guanylyltransferase